MHLKELKLAGFKSFVEPTIVPFSSQLVAVVGPNGCGKSNIIDAVRWVMGESSAKNLRGESMADVIFNGSSNRKSVGQASVELVFDNSMGRLTGQYASYQEIAVKRIVTRDGESSYYLNGSRCRRRDITDIFLGTGAGARGYSIIGQDTISRLIEARPDDLRAYFEEAAGVSKYKERRRETLQRILHTRENLARLADIREELGKQLQRLERQAKAQEHYQSLKATAHLCKAEILALKWRTFTNEQALINRSISALSLQQEHYHTNIAALMNNAEQRRISFHSAQEQLQDTQVTYYQLKTEIVRLEENLQQQAREKQRLDLDKQQLESDLLLESTQLQRDSESLLYCEEALAILQVERETLQTEYHQHQLGLEDKQHQKKSWDEAWQNQQAVLNRAQHVAQVEQVKLQHLEQNYQQTQLRFEKNQTEQANLDVDVLQSELMVLQAQEAQLRLQQKIDEDNYQQGVDEEWAIRQKLSSLEQALHQAHDSMQALATEHAVLLARQQVALGKSNNDHTGMSQWDQYPRLAELLTVSEKWRPVCEMVLGEGLQAIVLDSMDDLWPSLDTLQGNASLFIKQVQGLGEEVPSAYPRLLDRIKMPCWNHTMEHIFVADNLAEALSWLPTLLLEQSIVTLDGFWLGPGFVKIRGARDADETGLLGRQQRLITLQAALDTAQTELSDLQTSRSHQQAQCEEIEARNHQLKQVLLTSNDALRALSTNVTAKQQALTQAQNRQQTLLEEHEELQCVVEALIAQKIQAECQLQEAKQSIVQYGQQLELLKDEKTVWENTLIALQQVVESSRKASHQADLQCQSETFKAQQLRDSIHRQQHKLASLRGRLEQLVVRDEALTRPDGVLHDLLSEKLTQHEALNLALIKQRELVEDLQNQLIEGERLQKEAEQQAQLVQDNRQQEQLKEQAVAIRISGILESTTAMGVDVVELLAGMGTEVTLEAREKDLVVFEEKISRLGAINLMAIEEYQTESERKRHLDAQYQDLMDALATLDGAIAKMDKETQLRLRETFDQINTAFQALFPRLFGGGRAQLELTCDNLLEAGILVMAQPPGKRNSTIHLLSGGEKAMTAVALVFAIFQLNPSPFCMLDEVDAPLDDLNVQRFCDLVQEMSKFVQFLFITHNKVTMELADHLIGVTMREPGVSRVVAVDVTEALSWS